jgi:archaellum biogenesis ATPase FlaH
MQTLEIKVEDSMYKPLLMLLENFNGISINKKNKKQQIKNLLQNNKLNIFTEIDNPLIWQKQQRKGW